MIEPCRLWSATGVLFGALAVVVSFEQLELSSTTAINNNILIRFIFSYSRVWAEKMPFKYRTNKRVVVSRSLHAYEFPEKKHRNSPVYVTECLFI